MPRLSLYRQNKSNDYRFFDRTISEMFTVGATDLYVHKYLGPQNQGPSDDFTQPQYDILDPSNIQDLLFLENRDRKYESTIFRLRGHYNVANIDFDLSQFGLFLSNDVIFITIHYNDMIDILGRKLMVGDVLELPHLTDYNPLNDQIPIALRRYYQITDGAYASEGFSQTWYPHLWRIKCEPLVDSQEFADILNQPINLETYMGDWDSTKSYPSGYSVTYAGKNYTNPGPGDIPPGVIPPSAPWVLDTADNLRDILSTYNKNLEINNAVLDEAKRLMPKTGYDSKPFYIPPEDLANYPTTPVDVIVQSGPPVPKTIIVNLGTFNGIRISAASLAALNQNLTDHDLNLLDQYVSVILEQNEIAPERTDTGSGALVGDVVLTARSLGPVSGPYPTADNTYMAADQYANLEVTVSDFVQRVSGATESIINIVDIATGNLNRIQTGLVVSATYKNTNLLADNTYITRLIDSTTFAISPAVVESIPAGTVMTIAENFTGDLTPTNDYAADATPSFVFIRRTTPRSYGYLAGYLTGEGVAPNGLPTGAGVTFPVTAREGDYFLRLDYKPNVMFRFDGTRWVKIGEDVRALTTGGIIADNQQGLFVNNDETLNVQGGTIPSKQGLSDVLRIQPD